MPFRPQHTLLKVDVDSMHTIDTRSVENLFGMWSVFSKTSDAVEDGKRLENLSWRLWNRETFCCAPEHQARSTLSPHRSFLTKSKTDDTPVPELSSSLDSVSTVETDDSDSSQTGASSTARRELKRCDSAESRSRGREKHITPIDLEKLVISIKEKKDLEPLSPLYNTSPSATANPVSHPATATEVSSDDKASATQEDDSTPYLLSPRTVVLESSASTVATDNSIGSENAVSDQSSSTEMSTHSIVRGFIAGGAPSSYRSSSQLAPAQPTPILKFSPQYTSRPVPPQKRKGPMFTIGTSSGEEESSLESHMYKNSVSTLSASLRRPGAKKQTSFKEEVAVGRAAENNDVFEDSDEEEDISESAIEDDDDSSDWEDSNDEGSGHSSVNDTTLFQRVDSRRNLTSRRSLLTSLMHEPDRAKALQNAASRSTPALRRSRTSSPNGPSVASSPKEEAPLQLQGLGAARAKPIIMTTSNTHQLALSPRTTRRNMLSTELTESLRKNLLWERQHKSSNNLAAIKRRHTSQDVKNLRQHPEPAPVLLAENDDSASANEYFEAGLQEYHNKGW
ncbi:hypothetical protein LTR66_012337 [Elasticomyces elasticus]|nr:hypothetical protein LTR66_012337 [Elasticomyces elasticus]